MTSAQIKDVPEETHAVLRRRAAAAHRSLQEHLRTRLVADAATATIEEALARIETRRGGTPSFEGAAPAVRADRDSR